MKLAAGPGPGAVWDRSAAFAAGALSLPVYDLVAWDDALIHTGVVSPASFKAMTTSNGFAMPGGGSYGSGSPSGLFDNRRPSSTELPNRLVYGGNLPRFSTVVLLWWGPTNDQDADPEPLPPAS